MPDGIFYKGLKDHWRNINFIAIYFLVDFDLVFKCIMEAKLFQFKVELQHFNFFFKGDKILIAMVQHFPLKAGEFGKITICLVNISFQNVLLNAIERIENKMWIHLCPQCSKLRSCQV